MSKLVLLASFTFAACASTGATLDPTGTMPRARVPLDLTKATTGVRPAFPATVDRAVPSIDRMAHSIRQRLGGIASADLELCVAPAGTVTKVTLAKSSSFEAFDAALVRDAKAWQFESMPGPATVQSCRRATVAYRAR